MKTLITSLLIVAFILTTSCGLDLGGDPEMTITVYNEYAESIFSAHIEQGDNRTTVIADKRIDYASAISGEVDFDPALPITILLEAISLGKVTAFKYGPFNATSNYPSVSVHYDFDLAYGSFITRWRKTDLKK